VKKSEDVYNKYLCKNFRNPVGKTGESYNIECHNCSHEKLMWGKIKKQALSCFDIASLKSILRKL
jgi:DNA-directed RNA polymerase subunit RPC12/RpoP